MARKNQPSGVAHKFESGAQGAAGGRASTTADIGEGGGGIDLPCREDAAGAWRKPPRLQPGRGGFARPAASADGRPRRENEDVSREDDAGAWRKPLRGFAELPRGIRNRNPLNIRFAEANDWRGEIPHDDNTDREFEQFEDAVFGLRAAIRLMRTHFRRGADTIRRLATVWAPPGENPHLEAYIRTVAKHARIDADTVLDLRRDAHLRPVLLGMIQAENGVQPYDDATVATALALAAEPSLTANPGVRA